jgi:inhibitor of KinA sporulation pathway (predicted exonuclease)
MSTTINEEKTVTLIDGTKITVRPLKISLLRPFMKKFEGIAAVAEDNDKSMSLLMECVQIAMQQYNPELAGDLKALEENLDLPTVYKIVEEASGVKLSDASLVTNLM